MINRERRARRSGVVAVAGVCALGLMTFPASAKADIYFVAGPHNVRLGRPMHLTGDAMDDNATFNRFCVQRRFGHGGWVTIRCSPGAYDGGGGLNVWLRPRQRGLVLFRGVLVEGSSPRDAHPRVQLVSRAFALAVT